MACMNLHNLMWTLYPNIQNAYLDREAGPVHRRCIARPSRGRRCASSRERTKIDLNRQRTASIPQELLLQYCQASDGVPYICQPPVLYFPRLCPTSAGARPVSIKKNPRPRVVSDARGTPADTRPCIGRRVFRRGYDGAAMRELGESPVKFSSKVKISPSSHRCGFKQHTPRMSDRCPAGVRPSSVKIASLAHRNLIGRACDWAMSGKGLRHAFQII